MGVKNVVYKKEVINEFVNNNIRFVYQANKKEFNWLKLQSLDFYLPDYNIAIEVQGKQHFNDGNFGSANYDFKKQYRADLQKNMLCKNNNIKLLYYANKSEFKLYTLYNNNNIFFNVTDLINEIINN